jgi:hypothetical protein
LKTETLQAWNLNRQQLNIKGFVMSSRPKKRAKIVLWSFFFFLGHWQFLKKLRKWRYCWEEIIDNRSLKRAKIFLSLVPYLPQDQINVQNTWLPESTKKKSKNLDKLDVHPVLQAWRKLITNRLMKIIAETKVKRNKSEKMTNILDSQATVFTLAKSMSIIFYE